MIENPAGFEILIRAPINIALIKYWGKRNEELMLPLNDSISISINALAATTRITLGAHIKEDVVELNGKRLNVSGGEGARFRRVFEEVRRVASLKRPIPSPLRALISNCWHIQVVSETNFPVAAGLASSAAGFAAIACGLGRLFQLPERAVVRLARLGSGSACRSVKEGFVHWRAGTGDEDDFDCHCESLAPSGHWPELRAVIVVLQEHEKKVGSSVGMRNTVRTSTLLKTRVKKQVPKRVKELIAAIEKKDFHSLAQITMAESNQLHAVCLDTFPPLNYLTADSHAIIEFVHAFNEHSGLTKLAYTFDAGPNACLLMKDDTLDSFYKSFSKCFRFEVEQLPDEFKVVVVGEEEDKSGGFHWPEQRDLSVKSLVVSEVGVGPTVDISHSLDTNDNLNSTSTAIVTSVDCKML